MGERAWEVVEKDLWMGPAFIIYIFIFLYSQRGLKITIILIVNYSVDYSQINGLVVWSVICQKKVKNVGQSPK